MKRFIFVAIAALTVLSMVTHGCSRLEEKWYEGFLPESIEVESTIFVDAAGGFTEGCGVAIYKIKSDALFQIRKHGMTALKEARRARQHNDRSYDEWQLTPYIEPSDSSLRNPWLSGMNEGCSDMPADVNRSIDHALATPGSFYATSHESGVIIIPSLGWIIFSHFG